ncbi:unnamed protein product [Adineta steineri]|uniref:Intraflagellar transport protein 43-like protein n=1 Tax=Adineta steineri TaxID=433720 RepID=A0A814TXF8_9BILA|nr:unnamed protein product [Adineta steineri]CAF1552930.1 unnamed protein product [Adineta steineri]
MSTEDWLGDEQPKTKSRKKSKAALDEPIDDTFDAMLESVSKAASRAGSTKQKQKQKPVQKPTNEAPSGWSNDVDNEDDTGGNVTAPPIMRRTTHRAAEEIIATDIPTIPMDDADGDDNIDMAPDVAVAPDFSVHQIATFKEIEKEFSRTRASQYIDSKVDIGILYHHLNLQEEFDTEENKPWDWDKLFVEVRNAITNPITE